jgi:hypothetical protein
MWIIPQNLRTSHSVQGTEELTSDSRERLAELFEASLMWRSKLSQSRTWSRRLKTDTSTQRLSTRILKPSRGDAFADEWTSSLGASLVSHLVPQDEEPETTTPDTSSPTSSTVSESWEDLPLFSWRTSKGSSHQSSRVTGGQTPKERPFCSMSLESWKGWVTTRRREYSQRVKSARPINESACLSWRVAPISASQDALLFQRCSSEGEGLAWGTPRVGAAQAPRGGGNPNSKEFNFRLENQVQPTPHQEAQMWSTPRADKIRAENLETLEARARRHGRKSYGDLPTQALQPTPRQEAQMWRTPTAGNDRGSRNTDPQKIRSLHSRGSEILLAHQVLLTTAQLTPHQEAQNSTLGNRPASPAKLNPRWVETLMGLPVGWTMPSCADPWTIEPMSSGCLETELSQTQPREPFTNCGAISSSEDDEP